MHGHYAPRSPLSDYVQIFWSYAHYSQPHSRERLLPTGTMNLVVTGDENGGASAMVSGAHSRSFLLDTSRPFSAIGVSFKAGGGFPFFGLPADELHNLVVPLDTLVGREGRELCDRLLEAPTTRARFLALERFLLARLDECGGRSGGIRYALDAFAGAGRVPKVATVAEQIGWTAGKLIAKFRGEVGLPPKTFCRVARFGKVLAALDEGADVDWCDVALSCGYFDQPHFAHDFKEFAGITPAEYLRERVSRNHVRIG
jgi:AraC-like DNA-binding protein